MSARIIPYMRRRTADEWRRRRQEIIYSALPWLMLPALIAQALWMTWWGGEGRE